MADEIPLPVLPSGKPVSGIIRPRKRLRHYDPSSSDGPVFSSDPISLGLDERTTLVRAKKRKPTDPYDDSSKSFKTEKRCFKRNNDSGIYMASDETVAESSEVEDIVMHRPHAFDTGKISLPCMTPHIDLEPTTEDSHLRVIESLALDIVQSAIDSGRETVDLYNVRLTSGPLPLSSWDEILRAVQLLNKGAAVGQTIHSDSFESFVPETRLFINACLLTTVPSRLLDVANLTVLSLRGNSLAELPAAIAQLKKLEELDVSHNKLPWLPIELSSLPHLVHLVTFPNPWITEEDLQVANVFTRFNPQAHIYTPTPEERISTDDSDVWRCYRRFLDIRGFNQEVISISQDVELSQRTSISKVQSLFGLALKKCCEIFEVGSLLDGSMLDFPNISKEARVSMENAQRYGCSACWACGQNFVTARSEVLYWGELRIGPQDCGSVALEAPWSVKICSLACESALRRRGDFVPVVDIH